MYLKKALTDVKLKITDAAGKDVRELAVPANRAQPGIQTVCWDMRVEPIAPAARRRRRGAAAAAAARRRRGCGGAGAAVRGGGSRRRRRRGRRRRTRRRQRAAAGSRLHAGESVRRRRRSAAAADAAAVAAARRGPMVLPGTYNVALVVAGKVDRDEADEDRRAIRRSR